MAAISKTQGIVGHRERIDVRLLISFGDGELAGARVPTVFENFVATIEVRVGSVVWDTAAQEDYDRLRPLSYLHGYAIFIIDSPYILKNNSESGRPELHHFCPSVSTIHAKKNHLRSDLLTLLDPAMTK
ncbi:hypothetical protein HPB52_016026 [Rhipicephalus sanguineus]|uniref:Uncharacterized protein n=1 Tax=Rhipicephalus sanguineus TaxID=34632 RepID=A0A9D4TAR8_RHISA|nr:hypothetical protein HPB52_016026 [Rhipicephalus sanguineus]